MSARLELGLRTSVNAQQHRLDRALSGFSPELVNRQIYQRAARLESIAVKLAALPRRIKMDEARLAALSRALSGLNPKTPKPGFARVETDDGAMIAAAATLQDGQAVRLVFSDGARGARIDGGEPGPVRAKPPVPPPRTKAPPAGQGDLF